MKKILPMVGIIVLAVLLIPRHTADKSTFAPIILYNDGGITITLQDVSTEALKLNAENQSGEDIRIYGESAIINGFSFPAMLMQDVYSQKVANTAIIFDSSALADADISTIADVSFYIHITGNSERDIYSGRIGTTIDGAYSQAVNSSGVVVYSSDDYFISARPYDLNNPRRAAMIYVENKTDNRLSLVCDSLSINGKMLNGIFSLQNVEARSRAQFILDPYILKTFNDDNAAAMDISHVEDMAIQLGLTPWNGNSFSTADTFSSDVVHIIGS